jgi:hypothetical protein
VGQARVTGRPAFYALERGGWRDYVTVLHLPYTIWNLAYVVIGASLAPVLHWWPLAAALAAFGLALGVGAHALDELHGRPLRTAIPDGVLVGLAVASIGGAVAIGIASAVAWTLWLLPFVAAGGFVVVAYNLELFGGRFHTTAWLAASWGGLPILTAYLVQTGRIRGDAVLAAGFGAVLIVAQRALSTEVRAVRRRAVSVEGEVVYGDGSRERVDRDLLLRGRETALRAMAVAVVLLAAGLLLMRVA